MKAYVPKAGKRHPIENTMPNIGAMTFSIELSVIRDSHNEIENIPIARNAKDGKNKS
jgi:hypothetical protein